MLHSPSLWEIVAEKYTSNHSLGEPPDLVFLKRVAFVAKERVVCIHRTAVPARSHFAEECGRPG